MGPARFLISRMRLANAALLLACLVAACGGSDGGLSADEILDRAANASDVTSVHTIHTSDSVFIGLETQESTEITFDDGNYRLVQLTNGVPVFEALYYDGASYTTIPGLDAWLADPDPGDVYLIADELEATLRVPGFDDFPNPERLDDDTIDGRSMLRVQAQLSESGSDLSDEFRATLDELGADSPFPVPEELIPDEIEATITLWFGADDFRLYRSQIVIASYADGETIIGTTETIEISGYNEPHNIPNPIPEPPDDVA